MANREAIRTRIYKLLNEKSDSSTFDETTVNALIDEVQSSVCRGDIVDLITNRTFKSPFLRFLATKQFLKTVSPVTLGGDITTASTTITMTTANFDASGYIYINGDIIQYTGTTSTTLTGVTGIATSHDSGEQIKQAYALPSTAYKGFNLRRIVDNNETVIPFLDDRAFKDISLYWTLVTDSSTTEEFIVIEGINTDDDTLVFDYYKDSTDLSSDSSSSDLPDPYALQVLAPLIAGEFLYYTEEQQTGLGYLKQGYCKLNEMYMNYGLRTKEFRKTVKTKAFDLSTVGSNYPHNSATFRNCNNS